MKANCLRADLDLHYHSANPPKSCTPTVQIPLFCFKLKVSKT